MSRSLAFALALLLAPSALAQDPAAPFDPTTLTGSWSVTGKSTGGIACPNTTEVLAYQWILRVSSNGETSVTAQGETSFPKMEGQVTGRHLEVSGNSSGGDALAHFAVEINGDTFEGTRTWISTSLKHCTWSVKGQRL